MKVPCPDWQTAKGVLEGYAEDGVTGTLGYDDTSAIWYADLNDTELTEYQANLIKNRKAILKYVSNTDWSDSANMQACAIVPPMANETRLALYLVDCGCVTARGFKINNTIEQLINRDTATILLGSICEKCGKQMLVVMTWEDVKPKKKGGEP